MNGRKRALIFESDTLSFEQEQIPSMTDMLPENKEPTFLRRLLRSEAGTVGAIIVAIVVLMAIFSEAIAPYEPDEIRLADRLQPPSLTATEEGQFPHIMGTDSLGRDLFSRVVFGSRISLILGFTATIVGGVLGITMGMLAGFYGNWIDSLISWLTNVQLAFPFTLLAIFVIAIFGSGLMKLVLVLAIGSWVSYARITRGQVLSVKEKDFVEAGYAVGLRPFTIMWKYILPNVFAPLIVIATFNVASVILAEASLSFLGLGVDPQIPTWGAILADGRNYLQDAWWIATLPGLAILFTVLGINLFGDWLRDYLDPTLRYQQ